MSNATASGDVVQTFFANIHAPTQSQLDMLTKKLGIPIMALAHDRDGGGTCMGMIRVERSGQRFDFSDDPVLRPICGFIAWNRWDEPEDIVGWSPRDDWTGSWKGQAVLLGEHELQSPRLGTPLPVHLDVASWLRSHREGVVAIDRKRAWRALEGLTVAAETVDSGMKLRKILASPEPRIVVRAQAIERAAA
ncbi:hypothetical protein [Lichenihabitans psoromatis]|uniref:hypothetical protein n=1 Tax=Lichenihabitans psoromatis TaxID=2528642 RepID=UPI001038545A|nr:hypothetical protein [Lichenihabitans psoromatis]